MEVTKRELELLDRIKTLENALEELKIQDEEDGRKLDWLDCLIGAGVDNWDGYELAREMFFEIYKEEYAK